MHIDQYANKHYELIASAINYLATHRHLQPNLQQLAAHIGLSEFHLQRLFSHWAGISPKQFLQFLNKEYAKQKLQKCSVMETALSTGLSGGSRLHDLLLKWESMTPGEYQASGAGLTITYGLSASPFGQCFIALTERGICKLAFVDSQLELQLILQTLKQEWYKAYFFEDQEKISTIAKQIFNKNLQVLKPLHLLLKGSSFQIKVWEALIFIPEGELVSYQTIAKSINAPNAVRATASAIARNHIAYLIPCHRVIRQTGDFGQYRWNSARKQALIAFEAAKA